MLRRIWLAVAVAAVAGGCFAIGQQPQQENGRPEGGFRRMQGQGVAGNITAISGNTITLQTLQGTATVKVSADTQFRKDREPAKLTDLKVGDMVFALGDKTGENAWNARMVAMRTGGPGMMNVDDLGKKFIIGEVTKIDGTKITVKRPDSAEQTIEVDDDTSFRNAKRESVTLADVKVGDRVGGRGELKNGVFVPSVLTVGLPEGGFMMGGRGPRGAREQSAPANGAPKQDKKQ
jgi:hypothetical protein